MNLTRINYECDECGFTWRAPIWEPLWISKLCFKDIHAAQHAIGNGSTHPLIAPWLEWERNRIIDLLKANQVLRVDALGSLVFVNCDTLEVEYLDGLKGNQK